MRDRKEKKGEKNRERERGRQGWLSRRQNISLVPYDGAGLSGGVGGGGPYFYQYLASCARAARSIPSDEPSRSTRRNRQRERKKKWEEKRGRERRAIGGRRDEREEDERRALVCVCAYASNECVHRIQVVVKQGKSERKREMEGDRLRTPLGQNGARLYSAATAKCILLLNPPPPPPLLSYRFFLILSLLHSSFPFLIFLQYPLLLFLPSPCLLPSVQVFPHADAKSTELLGIIAAPGLDSRREYISSTLGGKLCP